MKEYRKDLGKVVMTSEGAWDRNKEYDVLSIVYEEHTEHAYISRLEVPSGIDISDHRYWMPFNVSGYSDANIITLSDIIEDGKIQSYTIEEAIKSISFVGRKPGCILTFYNDNVDRLDIQKGCWEIWQFGGNDISEWENLEYWVNIYYNYNKFVGWYKDEIALKNHNSFPEIGCYAYVGLELNDSIIYRCDSKHIWTNTTQHAWDYVKIILDGNITIGENGNWFNNGIDTNIPVSIKGENGKTPIFRNNNNIIEYSYDNENWNPISDQIAAYFRLQATPGDTQANDVGKIQISRDKINWQDLSNNIINNLHIDKYISIDETLPIDNIAEGTIYCKGPYYKEDDVLQTNPIYRLWIYGWKDNILQWVDNGEFTSISAGIVQELGDSETEIMSQKAVKNAINDLDTKFENKHVVLTETEYGNLEHKDPNTFYYCIEEL